MMKTNVDRQAFPPWHALASQQGLQPVGFQSKADRGQAPVSQGARSSPNLVREARHRVDTASLSPNQPQLFSEQRRA